MGGMSRSFNTGSGKVDSIAHRTNADDSITITFRYLDSARVFNFDSTVNDFSRRYPLPATYINLGNTGLAAKNMLFSPNLNAGFDPGFHALDIYRWRLDQVRFFNTTRPYSELNYLLGGRSEQVIELLHTQNIRPNWNFHFGYRLINVPGYFKNQKTNHNNYEFTSWYQSKNKRYNNYFVVLYNKLQATENGGMKTDQNYLEDPVYKDRFNIPSNLGGDAAFGTDFFSNKIGTGNRYSDMNFVIRQQYDLGKKDSVVTDSTVIPLFYPRLRFEHTFRYTHSQYQFQDLVGDSTYYMDHYAIDLVGNTDTVSKKDNWNEIFNDFSIYQFPDAKNLQQFIKLGMSLQQLHGTFASGSTSFFNSFGHAEYRNKTRDHKWDIEANGKLYFTGYNSGDYQAQVSLQRFMGKKRGYLQLGFENTSRRPSFIYDTRSSFFLQTPASFKKENNTHLSGVFYLPAFKLRLSGHYYLLNNYTYVTAFYKLNQENTLFNVLQIGAEKDFNLTKHLIWHSDAYVQQLIGSAQLHLPFLYWRNRIGYEGDLGFKNLKMATGFEVRFASSYKADNYSPVLGQFFYQDSITIRNKVPDIAAYLHFRIRSFKAFVRAENLGAARFGTNGFGFTGNYAVAPGYAYPGMNIRVGIYWSFVN